MTKKQKNMLAGYNYAINRGAKTTLSDVYKTCSYAKQKAMWYCKELQNRLGGYNATIVGASSHFFSYAFKYYDFDINKECLCYCTHANDYKFPLE